jgi:hypothetical protein
MLQALVGDGRTDHRYSQLKWCCIQPRLEPLCDTYYSKVGSTYLTPILGEPYNLVVDWQHALMQADALDSDNHIPMFC